MKKKLGGVIKETIQQSFFEYCLNMAQWFGLALFAILVVGNMRASQNIHSTYFKMFDASSNNPVIVRDATVEFLRRIKGIPEFGQYFAVANELYGPSIQDDVYNEEVQRHNMIARLEEVLTKNPQSRDALYSLHLLYKDQGDDVKALQYLQQAETIDPMVGR